MSDFEELFAKLDEASPAPFKNYILNESIYEANRFKRKSLVSMLEQRLLAEKTRLSAKSSAASSTSVNQTTTTTSSSNNTTA